MDDLWRALTPRPFTCVHADVHRRNMIVGNGTTTFLDWELALWGDPVYDLGVHIHKMGYLPEETDALITRWQAAMPSDHTTGGSGTWTPTWPTNASSRRSSTPSATPSSSPATGPTPTRNTGSSSQ